jgi:hypothetical protein
MVPGDQVRLERFEPISANLQSINELRQLAPSRAAEAGALLPKSTVSDPDLALAVEHWASLPAATRARIVAVVKSV